VDAQVGEAGDLVAEPDDHELLVEEGHGERLVRELVDAAHGMPAAPQGSVEARLALDVEVAVLGAARRTAGW
jgi:hypothetical protein